MMHTKEVNIGNVTIGSNNSFVLIAGPCSIESEHVVMKTAEYMKRIADKYKIQYIFKSSFDKANRSSIRSYRGMDIDIGLKILERVKKEFSIPVTTDIHLPDQAETIASHVDLIQIPAFLCRQTDLILAASSTMKPVNIKKGQFLAPWDMKNVIDKILESDNRNIILTERGTCFGYNNLIVDMTGIVEMRKFGYPVIFDATHSVQKPGALGYSSGGNREYVEYLARAATAVGIDGLFMEVHPEPDSALSDGPNMVKLECVEGIIDKVVAINTIINNI